MAASVCQFYHMSFISLLENLKAKLSEFEELEVEILDSEMVHKYYSN